MTRPQAPNYRPYTIVAPMFDRLAESLRAEPTTSIRFAEDDLPGKHRRAKQIRVHTAMTDRGLKVQTSCDDQAIFVRLRMGV